MVYGCDEKEYCAKKEKLSTVKEKAATMKGNNVKGKPKVKLFEKQKDYKKVEPGKISKKKRHIRRKWLITKEGSANARQTRKYPSKSLKKLK